MVHDKNPKAALYSAWGFKLLCCACSSTVPLSSLLELHKPFISWNLPTSGIFYELWALQVLQNTPKHHFCRQQGYKCFPEIKKKKSMKKETMERKWVAFSTLFSEVSFSISWHAAGLWGRLDRSSRRGCHPGQISP